MLNIKTASLLVLLVPCFFYGCAPVQPVIVERRTPERQAPPPVVYNEPAPQPQQEAGYQKFYDELSPYGRWIDYPDYGYVWQPNVDADFEPYSTNGHWVYSEESWTWVSGYQWGWAAFHYGRWFNEEGYGWLWVPGKEWAPAWVTWGQSGGYYGWAPLGPRVNANENWQPPARSWTFVPQEHITKPNVHDYVVNKTNNITIVKNVTVINNITNNNTTIINRNVTNTNITNNNTVNNINNNHTVNNNVTNNNINNNTAINNHTVINNNNTVINNNVHNKVVYNAGPQIKEVEKVTNVQVQKMQVSEHVKPAVSIVNNNKLMIYRPVIKEPMAQQAKPAPRNVVQYQPKKINKMP